jgi:uncharacterized protein (DUF433 family)
LRGGGNVPRIDWRERIKVDPKIHHGDPCIKGTRVPVSMLVGSLAEGMTESEILDEYPQLKPEDIRAALAYAAEIVEQESLLPLAS